MAMPNDDQIFSGLDTIEDLGKLVEEQDTSTAPPPPPPESNAPPPLPLPESTIPLQPESSTPPLESTALVPLLPPESTTPPPSEYTIPPTPPPLSLEPLASESASVPQKKEKVKERLKKEFQIPPEELPVGIDRRSTYFRGAALDLPAGWVIELRPRPGGRHEDQFFHERVTGKQFRSMKEVLKHLGSSSNQSNIDESEDVVACTWTAIMKKRGKRKRTNEPQPEIQQEPEPHGQPRPPTDLQPEAEPQVQPQPQHEPGPEPFARNNPPMSVVWCLQPAEEKRWIPEVPNAEHYRSLWWEVSGFTSSNPNTDQAGGSGQEWRK